FVIYLLHPYLFAVAAMGALILFIIALANEFATRTPLRDASHHSSNATNFSQHLLSHAETVESMGMLPGLKRRWLEENRKALSQQAKASDRAGVMTAMSKFVRPVLQVAILGTGAWLALAQEISPGAMVAASIIMGRALAPVEGAISNWRSFVMARASYGRLKEIFLQDGRHVSKHPLRKPKGLINVEKLVLAPPGVETPVIKGISFAINPGEVVGVIGPSASGKSTLARALVGVWGATNGSVRLDGMNIHQWNHLEVGENLGYLPQDVELFEGTIADNISRFNEAEKDAVIEAAVMANVHDLILHLPRGYDTIVGPGGAVLSGGQRQRIGLARAIFGAPKFIVLDEPNSNLDSEGEAALRQALEKLKESGATVVVIAHRPSVLSVADKIMVLRDGMIEQYGPRDEVMGNVTRVVKPPESKKNVASKPKRVA
ncbi:MAG: type I secretion system permease/ATPase, partial [Pseudomonadota bacterium]